MIRDGDRQIIAGRFQKAGEVDRNYIAAIQLTPTVEVVESWNPNANQQVNALVGSNGTYFLTGSFSAIYYKAIPMQARCLPCHGPEDMMPEVIRDAVEARYPDDQARGSEQGDLRGLLVFGLEPHRGDGPEK